MRIAYQPRQPGEQFKTVSINLPETLLEKAKAAARARGVSFSRFIRELLERELKEEG